MGRVGLDGWTDAYDGTGYGWSWTDGRTDPYDGTGYGWGWTDGRLRWDGVQVELDGRTDGD